MKKLMFAAAAIAVGVAMADVQSANIVGYQNKTLDAFQFVGPDFINCDGTEDVTLADLKFNCVDDEYFPEEGWSPNDDMINLLDVEGNNEHSLVYINTAWAEYLSGQTDQEVKPGWYDGDDVEDEKFSKCYSTEPLTFGMAIQINAQSGNDNIGIGFSGQVKNAPTITDLTAFMAVANCTPVDIKIADFKFNCVDDEYFPEEGWSPNDDMINLLDVEGNNEHSLVYINTAWAEYLSGQTDQEVKPGWYDGDDVEDEKFSKCYSTEPVLAGEGIQVNAQSGNEDITVQVDPAL